MTKAPTPRRKPTPRKKAPAKADRLVNPERLGDPVYAKLYGARKALDGEVDRMNQKWGVDRLVSLVSPDMAAKFETVWARVEDAHTKADADRLAYEAGIAFRGLVAMDQEATRLGRDRLPSDVWEYEADGKVVVFCYTDEDARAFYAAKGIGLTDVVIVSLPEMMRLFFDEKLSVVAAIKQVFPDSSIQKPTPKTVDDGEVIEDGLFGTPRAKGLEDDIPF